MLNKWIGMGRITAPLELKATGTGTSVLSFSIAVERDFKNSSGEKQTDFIDCVAWKNTAEFISRYFDKGSMICIEGALNKRSYTAQDGTKRHITEVVVDKAYFTGESKKTDTGAQVGGQPYNSGVFVDDEDDEPLPF